MTETAERPHVLMIASENDALTGGKVGGIGDVVRDVPPALSEIGYAVTVLTPGYGFLSRLPGAKPVTAVHVSFAGEKEVVDLIEIPAAREVPHVRHLVLEHTKMQSSGRIYWDDPPTSPFAADATKFALFSAAAGQVCLDEYLGKIDVLHLHDWHAGVLSVLRRYDPLFKPLQDIRCVVTLHNVGLQGQRPFSGHESSLSKWFPSLDLREEVKADIRDQIYRDCFNPMRAAIRLADAVHTVSPQYAQEILAPSDPARGYYGGEGLDPDLNEVQNEGRLYGILNGCEYSETRPIALSWDVFLRRARDEVIGWASRSDPLDAAHLVAYARLTDWLEKGLRPNFIVTSVGRCAEQKIAILEALTDNNLSGLDLVLNALGDNGVFICLGTGQERYERFLTQCAGRNKNMVFLQGFSNFLAQKIYELGDLFLMPSGYEPCGISQMVAMRAGQPCLVHGVGGLQDTVIDNRTGYVFYGDDLTEQAKAMHSKFAEVLKLHDNEPEQWTKVREAAIITRFRWNDSVKAYHDHLYCQ